MADRDFSKESETAELEEQKKSVKAERSGNPRTALPRWEGGAFIFLLIVAAGLRLWRLDQNGYGNPYYAAAVKSMLTSWHNFFYVSFDPGGFISVDKPPVALWAQAISARIFGVNGYGLLLPQALAGIGAVVLIWYLVRRVYGGAAGLLAAAVLAITPISIATDRNNTPDSLLVFCLLLAAAALIRATETSRLRPLLLCALLVGIGFNVKMLAAAIVLPTFALLYFLSAPMTAKRRLRNLAAAGALLAVVSVSWAALVDLTPADKRPYVGSTPNNSEIGLILGYNGAGRLTGNEQGVPSGRGGSPGGMPPIMPGMLSFGGMPGGGIPPMGAVSPPPGGLTGGMPTGMPMMPPGMGGGMSPGTFPGRPNGIPGFGGTPGLLRLTNREMAGQISWMLPFVGVGLLASLLRVERRLPLRRQAQSLLLWGGWLATYAVVFSLAKGIIHQYYLVALAPAVAALAGIGMVTLWREYRQGGWRGAFLPTALALTAVWQSQILQDYPDWSRVLTPILMAATLVSLLGLVAAYLQSVGTELWQRCAFAAAALGFVALLVSPSAWAITPVLAKGNNLLPSADPSLLSGKQGMRFGPPDVMEQGDNSRLIGFLQAHHRGERWLLMTGSSMQASPIILKTGAAVMAAGGFSGADPALSTEKFAELVRTRQVRYALISPMETMRGGKNGEVYRWIQEHGKPVDAAEWQSSPGNGTTLSLIHI